MTDLDHGGTWTVDGDGDGDGDVMLQFGNGADRYLTPADVRRMAEKLGVLNQPRPNILFRDVTLSIN